MEPYFTQEGNRPDLAIIEAVKPEGFIADQIYPVVPVTDMSGTVYYATINADSAAQTNRVDGAAPATTQIADSNTTFAVTERIKRYSITPKEAKQMGGIERADQVGAKASKRSVFTSIETSVSALTLKAAGNADATFDAAKVHTDVQTALDTIEQYEGVTALITSTKTAKAMVQQLLADATQGKVLSRIVSGSSPQVAVTGLNFNAWIDALAMYLGVDKVLLGASRIWNAGANAGRFAIARLDDGMDPLSHKYLPVLGKRFQYLPDGENPWSIEAVADRVAKNNHYDAQVLDNVVTLNSGALYVFDGVQDA